MRPIILLLASLALPAFAAERSGAEVYESTCSECHAKGKHHAPILGNAKQWNKLVREAYLGFTGDLFFVDTQGNDNPDYTGLDGRFLFLWDDAA